MPIPNPSLVKKQNAGKKIDKEGSGVRETDPREVKVIKQTAEMIEYVSKQITEHYTGVPLLVEMKYAYKETLANIMQEFNETGLWKCTKQFEPEEKLWLLCFEAIGQDEDGDEGGEFS